MWRKGNTFALLMGMQIGTATVESIMEIPKKIKNVSESFDSPILVLGIYLKVPKTLIGKNINTPMFNEAFTITKIWK